MIILKHRCRPALSPNQQNQWSGPGIYSSTSQSSGKIRDLRLHNWIMVRIQIPNFWDFIHTIQFYNWKQQHAKRALNNPSGLDLDSMEIPKKTDQAALSTIACLIMDYSIRKKHWDSGQLLAKSQDKAKQEKHKIRLMIIRKEYLYQLISEVVWTAYLLICSYYFNPKSLKECLLASEPKQTPLPPSPKFKQVLDRPMSLVQKFHSVNHLHRI